MKERIIVSQSTVGLFRPISAEGVKSTTAPLETWKRGFAFLTADTRAPNILTVIVTRKIVRRLSSKNKELLYAKERKKWIMSIFRHTVILPCYALDRN